MILDDIVAAKRRQLADETRQISLATLEKAALAAPPVRDFEGALRRKGVSIIAEVKKASPSKGLIAQDFAPIETAGAYEAGGADCVSVLTERQFFLGSDEGLRQVRDAVSLPVLRKDFLMTEFQILQARAIGADAVLLIAAILEDRTLAGLRKLAASLGMAVLMEAHTTEEAKRLVQAGGTLIGINNRDLTTFAVDLHTFGRVRTVLPAGCVAVAESGIHKPGDVALLRDAGCDAILVGESLMRSGDPVRTLAAFRHAGGRGDMV
jgi:indole-3-glycerol phosphate synthase